MTIARGDASWFRWTEPRVSRRRRPAVRERAVAGLRSRRSRPSRDRARGARRRRPPPGSASLCGVASGADESRMVDGGSAARRSEVACRCLPCARVHRAAGGCASARCHDSRRQLRAAPGVVSVPARSSAALVLPAKRARRRSDPHRFGILARRRFRRRMGSRPIGSVSFRSASARHSSEIRSTHRCPTASRTVRAARWRPSSSTESALLVRAVGRVVAARRGRQAPALVLAGVDRGERVRLVEEAGRAHVTVQFLPADRRPDARPSVSKRLGVRVFITLRRLRVAAARGHGVRRPDRRDAGCIDSRGGRRRGGTRSIRTTRMPLQWRSRAYWRMASSPTRCAAPESPGPRPFRGTGARARRSTRTASWRADAAVARYNADVGTRRRRRV